MSRVDSPVVRIAQGELRGRYFTTDGGVTVNSFQGIPYARPPLGKLRFQAPEPAEPWQGIRNATKEGRVCTQKDLHSNTILGAEDCLFINVYTPRLSGTLLPVMFWVHGGGFSIGSGSYIDHGPHYLLDEDVVVVNFNYRLGAAGFLSLENHKTPGNNGLKDQVAALRWVRDNISSFGGDPHNVTVFGESSGAACVQYLMVSNSTRGLFHKAISQSGSALNPWTVEKNPRQRALALCTQLDHPTTDIDDAFDFLQSVPIEELVLAQATILTFKDKCLSIQQAFVPSIENEYPGIEPFVTEPVLHSITNGKFHNIPYITGFNSSDGIVMAWKKTDEFYSDLDDNFHDFLPPFVPGEPNSEQYHQLARLIRQYYFKDDPITTQSVNEYVNMSGDTGFMYGICKTAQIQSSVSSEPTWVYRFSYNGLSLFKIIFGGDFPGAGHGDELFYLFKMKNVPFPQTASLAVRKTKSRFIKMWTNFAKTGNPTPETNDLIPVEWKPITKDKFNYLEIGEELSLKQNPEAERIAFWDKLQSLPTGKATNEKI